MARHDENGDRDSATATPREEQQQHEDDGAVADTATPAKRQRVDGAQQQQQRVAPAEDHGKTAMPLTLELAVKPQRKYQEFLYKDSTCAVIGPGFQVRELLMGDEFVSFRLSSPGESFLHDECTRGALADVLRESEDAIEYYAIDTARSFDPAGMTKEQILTVHLTSKAKATPFIQKIEPLRAIVKNLKVQGFGAHSPLDAPWEPPVITQKVRSSVVSTTWSTGVATGGGRLSFRTASAANEFYQRFLARRIAILARCSIKLIGYIDQKDAAFVQGKRERRSARWQKAVPPLAPVVADDGSVAWLFDEAKLASMKPKKVARFGYVAVIDAGLHATMDEDALMLFVSPHECAIKIDRRADGSTARVDPGSGLFLSLQANATHGDSVVRSEDTLAMRAGVHVTCSDWQRVKEIKTRAELLARAVTEKPFRQILRTVATLEFCALLPIDIYRCFKAKFAQARMYASKLGVTWFMEGLLPEEKEEDSKKQGKMNDKVKGTHMLLRLQSHSFEALKRVEAALQEAIDCEPIIDPVLQWRFNSNNKWRGYAEELFNASLPIKEICVRSTPRERVLWIYGAKAARQETIHEMKEDSLAFLHKSRVNEESEILCCVCFSKADDASIQFDNCSHTCCLKCIKPGVTPSNALPLRCPAKKCGKALHINDVLQIADDVDALVAEAVRDFVVKRGPRKYVMCPKPGCNQALPRLSGQASSQRAVACGSCKVVYCLACSKACGNAVFYHEGTTCAEARCIGALVVDPHVHWICDRILTLSCPACASAFLDFDDCLSVACGKVTCGRHFCGCCLEYYSVDSRTTLDHVKTCPKNPQPGSLHATAAQLEAVQRDYRVDKLRKYLETQIPSAEVRRLVEERVVQQLKDLNILSAI